MGDAALEHVSGDVYLPVYVRQGSGDLATLSIHTREESEAPAEYWLRIPLLTFTENLTFLPHQTLNTAEDPDILYTLERNPNRIQIFNRIYKSRFLLLLTFG